MKNFIAPGEVIDVVLAAAVNSGGPVKVGGLVGIATNTGAIGDTVAVALEGVYQIVKNAGEAWNQGDKLYWDSVNNRFTTTAAGNTLAGVAFIAAQLADVTGQILLTNAV